MTNDSLISEQPGMRRLRAWNPLDHLRLLWWVLFAPGRLVAYWAAYGENAESKLWAWWVSTFMWFPLWIYTYSIKKDHYTMVGVWFSYGLVTTLLTHSVGKTIRWCWASIFCGWILVIGQVLALPWLVAYLLFVFLFLLAVSFKQTFITNLVDGCYRSGHTSWIVWSGFALLIVTYAALICIFPSLL